MGAKCLILTVAFLYIVHAQESPFEQNGVVPDLLEAVPKATLEVTYTPEVSVQPGGELTPTQVKAEPKVNWEAGANKFYTLIFTDLDAPSRKLPAFREIRHWLVVNIPGNKVSDGEIISSYMGSGPAEGSGLHRYVFLVYEQPEKLTFEDEVKDLTNENLISRMKFSTTKFATKYGLGGPVAANFYQAAWDQSVPPLADQIASLKARGIDLSAFGISE